MDTLSILQGGGNRIIIIWQLKFDPDVNVSTGHGGFHEGPIFQIFTDVIGDGTDHGTNWITQGGVWDWDPPSKIESGRG